MDKLQLEEMIRSLDEKIVELVQERDKLRALVALQDSLAPADLERLVTQVVSAAKTKAASVDAIQLPVKE